MKAACKYVEVMLAFAGYQQHSVSRQMFSKWYIKHIRDFIDRLLVCNNIISTPSFEAAEEYNLDKYQIPTMSIQ